MKNKQINFLFLIRTVFIFRQVSFPTWGLEIHTPIFLPGARPAKYIQTQLLRFCCVDPTGVHPSENPERWSFLWQRQGEAGWVILEGHVTRAADTQGSDEEHSSRHIWQDRCLCVQVQKTKDDRHHMHQWKLWDKVLPSGVCRFVPETQRRVDLWVISEVYCLYTPQASTSSWGQHKKLTFCPL